MSEGKALFADIIQKMNAEPRNGRKSPDELRAKPAIEPSNSSRRLRIDNLLVVAEQRYERSGRNPLYAWWAVRMCFQPGKKIVPLPRWCTDYLGKAAENLGRLADVDDFGEPATTGPTQNTGTKPLTPRQSAARVPRALGLARPSWSAFQSIAGDREKVFAKLEYDRRLGEGLTHEAALEVATKLSGRKVEPDAAKKAIQAGKKQLMQIPGTTRPTPRGEKRRVTSRSILSPMGKK